MERVGEFERGRAEYVYKERVASNGSSTSQAEIGVANSGVSRRGKESMRRMEHLDDRYSLYARGTHNRMDYDLNVNRPEYANSMGEDIRNPDELLRSRPPTDQWGVQGRFNYVRYHDEGPPRYSTNSSYEQGERARYLNGDMDGTPVFENLENNRAELLRELDNLKGQLSGPSDMTEKPKGWISTNQRMISPISADPYPRNHGAYVQESLSSSNGVNRPPLGPDDMASRYLREGPGFVSYSNRDRSSLRDSYPQRGYPHEYADTYHQQEMYQRSARHLRSQYMDLPYHEHFHGYHGNGNHGPFMFHPDENFLDQPACSCVQCGNKNRYLPPMIDPSGSYNQRSLKELSGSIYHHQLYPTRHMQQSYDNSSSFNNSHSREPIVLNSTISESDGTNMKQPRKVLEALSNEQVWRPIAGGAPIIACCKCFELLKIPIRRLIFAKKQQKLKCGACSSIILFELGNRGNTVPVSGIVDSLSSEIDDTSRLTVDGNVRYQHGDSNSTDVYTNSEPQVSPADKLTPSKFEKQLDRLSSTSSLSEDEQTPVKLASEKHGSPFAELHIKEVESFPKPRLSFEESSDHCSAEIMGSKFEKGNESKRSDFDYSTTPHNCVENSEVATERDISVNELLNSAISEESVDKSEEHRPMVKKGSESLLGGLIKKSFRNFRKSRQDVNVGKSQVVVNGHFIPDHLVEKAEALAGPVEPGEYWYDVRAGFWGVMGYPCLGLIMPKIEEFNYPMPKKCAGGDTGIFVNGRELHQKDLDLLTGRGLPNTSHGSYLVEISGQVVDQRTGEQLCNLGRLAPSVERAKHGFGMKVPSFIARLQR